MSNKKPMTIEEIKAQPVSAVKADLPELASALGVTEEALREELDLDDLEDVAGGGCCGIDIDFQK